MRAVPNAYRPRVEEFVAVFNEWGTRFGIDTPARVTHFLAQLMEESGAFARVEENLNYSAQGLLSTWPTRFNATTVAQYARQPQRIANKVYANRLGNGSEASGDGWNFRGRGLLQITGRANYQAYAKSGFCVGDLMSHPEWLTKSPGHTKSAMWFWSKNGLNAIADQDDGMRDGETVVTLITRRVNGGTNGLARRKYYYRKLRKEFGL